LISRIVGRHGVIVIRAGPNGPTYSSESKDGTVLTTQMTLEELASGDPAMFNSLSTMQADASVMADAAR
jgi:hypothetical protein